MTVLVAVFNVVLGVFIVSTMLVAGLGVSLRVMGHTLRNARLVALVLLANLLLVPLLGWGLAALFALAAPAYIALVLFASSPGAPFGTKLALLQRGDVAAGASMQIVLALIGSVTFAITATVILSAANVGGNVSVPVADLVTTIASLQLAPFALGLTMRTWVAPIAQRVRRVALTISNVCFVVVLADALLVSWRDVLVTMQSRAFPAMLLFAIVPLLLGGLLATGPRTTRMTMATLAPTRSGGPVFAAIAIGFADNPAILGAASSMVVVLLAVSVSVA
jgi:bile acid:Na+ symporter, BASS family